MQPPTANTIDVICTSLPPFTNDGSCPPGYESQSDHPLVQAASLEDYVDAVVAEFETYAQALKPTGWAVLHIPTVAADRIPSLDDDSPYSAGIQADHCEPACPALRQVLSKTWSLPTEVFWKLHHEYDGEIGDVPDQPLHLLTPRTDSHAATYIDRHYHSSGFASGAVWTLPPHESTPTDCYAPRLPTTAFGRALSLICPSMICARCRTPYTPADVQDYYKPTCTCPESADTAPPTIWDPFETPAVSDLLTESDATYMTESQSATRLDAFTPLDESALDTCHHQAQPAPSLTSIIPHVDV